jgi:hypothetical protein
MANYNQQGRVGVAQHPKDPASMAAIRFWRHAVNAPMKPNRVHLAVFALLMTVYGAWLAAFWPGIFGQDSLAVVRHVEGDGTFQSGKPLFWYLFVRTLYGPSLLVEWPVMAQLLGCALIFTRILGWCWAQGLKGVFFFVLVFIALAPPVLYYGSALYPDGLFAAAAAGLCFEAWLIARGRRVGTVSLIWLLTLTPAALFLRSNGIYLVAVLIPVLFSVQRKDKVKIVSVVLLWITAFLAADRVYGPIQEHGALFPLAVFESVNFVQPSATGLLPENYFLTEPTLDVLRNRGPIRDILSFYYRDYWDPLIYVGYGPTLGSLNAAQRDVIVREFLCCNLWSNFPAFAASRLNVFLVSALGKGWFTRLDDVTRLLPQTRSQSQIRPFPVTDLRNSMQAAFDWSFRYRWILWTPFLGIALVAALMLRGWRRRDWVLFFLVAPFAVQLGGIFLMSVAGEHRYMLPFFIGAAAWLPMWFAADPASPERPSSPEGD